MIAIVNITKKPKIGRNKYSLRINERELCQFYHNREDGLAECLEKAKRAYWVHIGDLMNVDIQKGDTQKGKE